MGVNVAEERDQGKISITPTDMVLQAVMPEIAKLDKATQAVVLADIFAVWLASIGSEEVRAQLITIHFESVMDLAPKRRAQFEMAKESFTRERRMH